MNVDEILIDLVQSTPWLYDKKHEKYKNSAAKKEKWSEMSNYLSDMYNVEMPAADLEKRWSSLRDMFSREQRKQTQPIPSGSGRINTKEWELYRNMLFLAPYIAHRKTKSSLQLPVMQRACSAKQHEEDEVAYDQSMMEFDESDALDTGTFCPNEYSTSSSPSTLSTNAISAGDVNRNEKRIQSAKRKLVPPMDAFATRKRKHHDKLDDELSATSIAISEAASNVSMYLRSKTEEVKYDGYMMAIKEGLDYVPLAQRTDCLIEVLKVIKNYEERS